MVSLFLIVVFFLPKIPSCIKLPKVKSIQRGYASDPETRTLVRHHHHHRFREFLVGKDMFNQGMLQRSSTFSGGKKLRSFVSVAYISLKLTAHALRIDRIKKGNNRLPTIHFQRQKR